MILAIGNAGCNILETNRREKGSLKECAYVFADSNEDDLIRHNADGCAIVMLNATSESFPKDIFTGIEKLVIVAGLGGHTGTKFSKLAAIAAKDSGVKSIDIVVTLPFHFEGEYRARLAKSAVHQLLEINGLSVVVFANDDLLEKYPELGLFTAFEAADKEIMQLIQKN